MSRRIIVNPSPPVNKNEILLTFFKRYGYDQLLEFIDWNNIAISAAYRTLAIEHFTKFADRLRSDLGDEFAEAANSYYEQQLAYWKESFDRETKDLRRSDAWTQGPNLLDGLLSQAFKPSRPKTPKPTPESMARSDVEYIKTDLITAALAGLVEHGEETDAKFARPYLYHDDYDLRLEAVRLVSRFGVPNYATDLIKIAKSTDGVLKEMAARGAIQVSKFDPEMTKTLLETHDEVLVSAAVDELIRCGDKDKASALLKPLLNDKNDDVRTKVIIFLSRSTLLERLKSY